MGLSQNAFPYNFPTRDLDYLSGSQLLIQKEQEFKTNFIGTINQNKSSCFCAQFEISNFYNRLHLQMYQSRG